MFSFKLLAVSIFVLVVTVNYCTSTKSYKPYYCNPELQVEQKSQNETLTCAYIPSINDSESNLPCKCRDECGPAILSVPIVCVDCQDSHGQWMGIIVFNFFLLTLLFFACVLFKINLAVCPLNVIVYLYQVTAIFLETSYTLSDDVIVSKRPDLRILVTIYGFFNLDFFRYVIPPQCMNVGYINVLYFEFIIATFPFLLCLIVYVLIKLHDKNVRCVVRAWRPFRKCFVIGDNWSPHATIINTYITFFLLSQSKVVFTTFKILHPSTIGNDTFLHFVPSFNFANADGNFNYYFLMSISLVIVFVFVLAPVLLQVLYPTRVFRKCLNKCRCLRQDILNILMDAFQGYYKDGTNGSLDYRYMSVIFVTLRLSSLPLSSIGFANNVKLAVDKTVIVLGFVHGLIGVFYFTAQPYKHSWMNKVDGTILVLLGMILCASTSPAVYSSVSVAVWIPVVPLLCGLLYLLCHLYVSCKKHKVLKRSKSSLKRKLKSKACKNKTADQEPGTPETNMNSSISADRVLYPRKYEESIFNRNQADQAMPEDPEGARGRRGSLVPLLLGRHDTKSAHSVNQSQSMTILSTGCVNTDYGITTSPIIGDPYDI